MLYLGCRGHPWPWLTKRNLRTRINELNESIRLPTVWCLVHQWVGRRGHFQKIMTLNTKRSYNINFSIHILQFFLLTNGHFMLGSPHQNLGCNHTQPQLTPSWMILPVPLWGWSTGSLPPHEVPAARSGRSLLKGTCGRTMTSREEIAIIKYN